jgi:23S rRNA-/tRNA-specific pseudouridylate synthase
MYGYVIDFLEFKLLGYNCPVFNVSDMAIVISVFLIIISVSKYEGGGLDEDKKRRPRRKKTRRIFTEKLETSRSNLSKHIKLGDILVNGEKVKAGYILNLNDEIFVPELKEETNVEGEDIPLDIYYEDDNIIVVNKPSGMVVHPASGNYHGTLVKALLGRTKLSDINGEDRPGIVHRIDKDTSGLLLIAKLIKHTEYYLMILKIRGLPENILL